MSTTTRHQGFLAEWWAGLDRWTLAALLILVGIGYVMMLSASPAVAERIGAASRHVFFTRQILYSGLAVGAMLAASMLPLRWVARVALLGLVGALVLTGLTPVIGPEINGARRWLSLPGVSLQPSEFLKPCLIVACAWLLAQGRRGARLPAMAAAMLLVGIAAGLLLRQPDVGMLMLVLAVFLVQIFISGIPFVWIGVGGAVLLGLGAVAYNLHGHVRSRVLRFLNPEAGDTFQVRMSLEAFGQGGLFGRGPGEGQVKDVLPDAHTDFVFPVAAEEFGLVACLLILGLFAFVVLRGLLRVMDERDAFVAIAATGLVAMFGLQAFINMASSLHMIPTKGMTLPFVSYGGSSVLALGMGMGFLLALTRRRPPPGEDANPYRAGLRAPFPT